MDHPHEAGERVNPLAGEPVDAGRSYMVTLAVWVDGVADDVDARQRVARAVDAIPRHYRVHNNGTVDIDAVTPWDYEG